MSAAAQASSRRSARTNVRLGASAAVVLALVVAAPCVLNAYGVYLVTLTGIFALVALGLDFLVGYAARSASATRLSSASARMRPRF